MLKAKAHQNFKKLLAMVVAIVLAIPAVSAFGDTFTDMDGHWASDTVKSFTDKRYMIGYPDGTFGPENNITNAEVATVVSRLGAPRILKATEFNDIESDAWYLNAAKTATAIGLIKKLEEFKGNEPMLRYEIIQIAAFLSPREDVSGVSVPFIDASRIPKDMLVYVQTLYSQGNLKGYPVTGGKFELRGDQPVTRAEFATLLTPVIKKGMVSNIKNWNSNMYIVNVTDKNGKPLSGVRVTVDGTNVSAVSNADGKALLFLPADGEYTITLFGNGFSNEQHNINVSGNGQSSGTFATTTTAATSSGGGGGGGGGGSDSGGYVPPPPIPSPVVNATLSYTSAGSLMVLPPSYTSGNAITVTVKNVSNAPITNGVVKSVAGPFTFTALPTPIPVGGTASVTGTFPLGYTPGTHNTQFALFSGEQRISEITTLPVVVVAGGAASAYVSSVYGNTYIYPDGYSDEMLGFSIKNTGTSPLTNLELRSTSTNVTIPALTGVSIAPGATMTVNANLKDGLGAGSYPMSFALYQNGVQVGNTLPVTVNILSLSVSGKSAILGFEVSYNFGLSGGQHGQDFALTVNHSPVTITAGFMNTGSVDLTNLRIVSDDVAVSPQSLAISGTVTPGNYTTVDFGLTPGLTEGKYPISFKLYSGSELIATSLTSTVNITDEPIVSYYMFPEQSTISLALGYTTGNYNKIWAAQTGNTLAMNPSIVFGGDKASFFSVPSGPPSPGSSTLIFNVDIADGLPAGTYVVPVTLMDGGTPIASTTFTVVVAAPIKKVALTGNTLTLPFNYGATDAFVRVTNTGNVELKNLVLTSNSGNIYIDTSMLGPSLPANDYSNFYFRVNPGLSAGTYKVTFRINADGEYIDDPFDFTIIVQPDMSVKSVSITPKTASPLTLQRPYTTSSAMFTVKNTGTVALTDIKLNANQAFDSPSAAFSLAVGESKDITMNVINNLAAGTSNVSLYVHDPATNNVQIGAATFTVTILPESHTTSAMPQMSPEIQSTITQGSSQTGLAYINITNNGATTLTNVSATSTLANFVPGAAIPSLAPGAVNNIPVTVNAGSLTGGTHTTTFTISSDQSPDLYTFSYNLVVISTLSYNAVLTAPSVAQHGVSSGINGYVLPFTLTNTGTASLSTASGTFTLDTGTSPVFSLGTPDKTSIVPGETATINLKVQDGVAAGSYKYYIRYTDPSTLFRTYEGTLTVNNTADLVAGKYVEATLEDTSPGVWTATFTNKASSFSYVTIDPGIPTTTYTTFSGQTTPKLLAPGESFTTTITQVTGLSVGTQFSITLTPKVNGVALPIPTRNITVTS